MAGEGVSVVVDSSVMDNRVLEWKDLDKLKFFTIGPALFVGVRFLVYPFSLIKTRLFMQSRKAMYTGTLDAFHQVLKHEGVAGLYKGFVASSFSLLSGQLYITSYQLIRSWMEGYSSEMKGLVGGFAASVVGQSVTVPSDVIAQKLMMQGQIGRSTLLHNTEATAKHVKLKGTVTVTREIFQQEGLIGFYRGYWISLMTYAPNSALWWFFYSAFYNITINHRLHETLPLPSLYVLCGINAGVFSAVLTNPLDVLRTRFQLNTSSTLRSTVIKIWQEEGVRCLTKGLSARLMYSGPASAIIVSSYELMKKICAKSDATVSL